MKINNMDELIRTLELIIDRLNYGDITRDDVVYEISAVVDQLRENKDE